ncbi:hypothetical protein DFH27DRAFT_29781 [Peziza echinospora]|nr:hypothetical protein DFH27DRAFT_29781 [Peziza echinospora]
MNSRKKIKLTPFSVQTTNKIKLAEDGKESTTDRRLMMENGHPGVEIDEAAIRRGENPYTKYYQQQGDYNPAVAATNGPTTPAHGATVVVP